MLLHGIRVVYEHRNVGRSRINCVEKPRGCACQVDTSPGTVDRTTVDCKSTSTELFAFQLQDQARPCGAPKLLHYQASDRGRLARVLCRA